jgi:pimeloyl-ACP methyl ester carboxylesterase
MDNGNFRAYGKPPFRVAVIHGGPGAAGEMAPVARELSVRLGVLEPLQTRDSLKGQVEELRDTLEEYAQLPVVLVGYSWGAWLSLIVAAHNPPLVRKLILVSSGSLEEKYTEGLEQTRLGRLNKEDRAQAEVLLRGLNCSTLTGRDVDLVRLGELLDKADAYDPIAVGDEEIAEGACRADIFQRVWKEAAELRRSGELLELARKIRCPVVAIHGDYDPHPADGVRGPLSAVVADFRFVLLEHCGHRPWIEREARERFFATLREEIK